ncbi:hypothetical protein AB0395_25770 [Streptosporangium sp. NPDC051023]|uniref:hypothetical protein n=1 Tax=Streptosporangium sp. NPDC051023 TaxID=3155410 RepID=UPI00344B4BF3
MPSTSRGETAVRAAFTVTGLITTLPILALVNTAMLEMNYGVSDPGPMVLALLQHRGVLQLLLGAALIWAAFFPPVRLAAAPAAILAKSAFLGLILPNAAARPDLSTLSIVFDLSCIVVLALVTVREVVARRAGAVAHTPA